MFGVVNKPDIQEKLEILSTDAQYDLACACGTREDEHRKRGSGGKWIYPVTLPSSGTSVLFKTLMSNVCSNDCKYCPLRAGSDVQRCSLGPEEVVKVFLDYYNRGEVFGLFLSCGVCGSADGTMEKLNRVARILRQREKYRGYIHLKVIPGASDAAIEEAVRLSTAVSLNIEVPGAKHLAKLSAKKDYIKDIIEPIKLISRLTGKGTRYERVKQTTQFIVGAVGETDAEIVKYMWGLYDRLDLQRVYFSAYQKGLGDGSLGGETENKTNSSSMSDIFMREHRLYQADFLIRKYGFKDGDILFEKDGNLSLEHDPKEAWAKSHPEAFPVDVNRAGYYQLLRVPGLGPVTVKGILERRKQARIKDIEDVGKVGARLRKARGYVVF